MSGADIPCYETRHNDQFRNEYNRIHLSKSHHLPIDAGTKLFKNLIQKLKRKTYFKRLKMYKNNLN